jgi:glycine betaine/choline ABC-type transport system substrate-binding protein
MECWRVPSSPSLRAALAELSDRLPDSVMRRMNALVDVDYRSATEVARSFLNEWE